MNRTAPNPRDRWPAWTDARIGLGPAAEPLGIDRRTAVVNPLFTPAQREVLLELAGHSPELPVDAVIVEFRRRTGRAVSRVSVSRARRRLQLQAAAEGGGR